MPTRREFLAGMTAGASVLFAACRSDPTPALREKARELGRGLDCSDVTMLLPAEVVTRTSNAYVQRTERDDQFCLSCLNYVPASAPKRCGSCKTVKGPINPEGWCEQWTAQRA